MTDEGDPVNRLPAETTTFVGRKTEVGKTISLLKSSRLVTVTGAGGVGKSRLALRVVTQLSDGYADGVVLAKLDTVSDPDLVAMTIAGAFGLSNAAVDPATALVVHLRDKNLLLLLDSCEHVVRACGRLARTLLAAAPRVRILATSQWPLSEPGERVLRIHPFAVLEIRDLTEARDLDAVKLFADRAVAVRPGFAVGEDNWARVVRLCRLLDGVPLAVELAAAWLRVLPLDEILSRMDDRFRLLVRRGGFAPPRQRSLLATVQWSHELCSVPEQLLWARLSVFRGTFDVASAQAVCGGDGIDRYDLPRMLSGLVEKSIVVMEEGVAAERYRMLDVLREYGREQLRASSVDSELPVRHCGWFMRLAERAEAKWSRGEDQLSVAASVHIELPNLRAALEFCSTTPGQEAAGLRLAVLLHFYWLCCGGWAEGQRWVEPAVARDPHPGRDRAMGLWLASLLAAIMGAPPDPRPVQQAEAWALAHGDDRVLGQTRLVLATYAAHLGELEDALALAEDAAARFAAGGRDITGRLLSLAVLSQAQTWLDRAGEGITTAEQALALSGDDGNRGQWAWTYLRLALGLGHWRAGDLTYAEASLLQGLRVADRFHDNFGAALLVDVLAGVVSDIGQAEWAAELLGIGERLWSELGGARRLRARPLVHWRDTKLRQVSDALGDTGYARAFRRGTERGDSLGEVLKRALSGPRSPARSAVRSLTKRERQVATLAAEGLTNRAIAIRLGIAQRTAETHVNRILRKLELKSRTHLAGWQPTADNDQ